MLRELLQALPGEGPGDPDLFPNIPVDPTPYKKGQDRGDRRAGAKWQPHGAPDGKLGAAYSGLNASQRSKARALGKKGVNLSFANSSRIGYTEGAARWDWHAKKLLISKGQYPTDTDCSGFGDWLLWNVLYVEFGIGDIVNGDHWLGGFTGTGIAHGKPVVHEKNIQFLDIAYYGESVHATEHEAVCIGGGFVASHGTPGVLKRGLHYRPDLVAVHRYL